MPNSPIVADSSVVIAYHEIGILGLLQTLFQEILVPPAVAQEVRPSLGVLPSWMNEVRPTHIHEAVQRLDIGEREALSLALEFPVSTVLVDDLPARRVAERLQVPIIGSVGILLIAKEQRQIELVGPYMNAMRATSLYLADRVYQGILRAAGEA